MRTSAETFSKRSSNNHSRSPQMNGYAYACLNFLLGITTQSRLGNSPLARRDEVQLEWKIPTFGIFARSQHRHNPLYCRRLIRAVETNQFRFPWKRYRVREATYNSRVLMSFSVRSHAKMGFSNTAATPLLICRTRCVSQRV